MSIAGRYPLLLWPATMGNERANYGSASEPQRRQHVQTGRRRLVAASLLVVTTFWLFHLNTGSSSDATSRQISGPPYQLTDFDWNTPRTDTKLHYTPCYDDLQCARLELPMDWFNGTTNSTISLAVIRQPAIVSVTHPQYGGAILLNPGGPGGSGIELVLRVGKHASSVVDTNTTEGKYFDLISFDPRGVGLSSPRVDCFHDPTFAAAWQQRVQEEGWFESSDAALGRLWSMSTAKGVACSNATSVDGDDIKKYVSTASAARDMLELVEKHGEWREREAKALQQDSRSLWARPSLLGTNHPEVPATLRYTRGEEKIQYYGVSYGSFLGGTFAAMFPDRVGRLVVDGVVEYNNYMSGNWSSNLVDTEKSMDSFYFHCARAGFPACLLANETSGSTPSDIKKRTNDILKSLYHNPLPVYTPSADVLSYSEMKSLIFGSLYSPVLVFPLVAYTLLAIEQKDSDALAPLVWALHPSACATVDDPRFDYATRADAQIAIACSDGDDQSYMDREAFQAFAQEMAAKSPSGGSLWSVIRMNCIHNTVPAVHRFTGPWKANTSHPLLFVGNTADPVTPGRYAQQMAEGFEGAVALMQDSGGHCSDSVFSYCTTGYLRQYFQTGELPPANTTCGVDIVPFGPLHEDMKIETVEVRAARERWEVMTEASLKGSLGIPGGQAWYALRQAMLR
jgi:pimeloyl-ACP methyl ester carboxylesterase